MTKEVVDIARELMFHGLKMRPVKKEDLTTGTGILVADVLRLYEHGTPIKYIGQNGTSLMVIGENPIRPHPDNSGRLAVYYNRADNENHRWVEGVFDLDTILRDEYSEEDNGAVVLRFFIKA